jgi:hypothetical protein
MKSQEKKERRSLLAGLAETGVDPSIEKAFVHGTNAKPAEEPPPPATPPPATVEAKDGQGQNNNTITREPLTTRIRSDFAKALKRASLERQLAGQFPNTMLEILEEALEPWLRKNGYLN